MTGQADLKKRVKRQREAWRLTLITSEGRLVLQQIRDWCGGDSPMPIGGPEASYALGKLEIGRKIDQAIREIGPTLSGQMQAEFDHVPRRARAAGEEADDTE